MNIRIFSIFAVAGMLLSSCTLDEIMTESGLILAEMENDQTRTAVTDEGVFTWSAGDKIWLQTTSGSVTGTLSSGAESSNAQFAYGSFIGEMTGKAVYPYNPGHSISENTLNVTLPASYELGTSLNNTNAIMFGTDVDGTLKFSHLAGIMRFSFRNVPAGTDRFTLTLDKKINGSFKADLTEEHPVIQTTEATDMADKTITLNFSALTKTTDIRLYVPLPVGTYDSLELGLYDQEQPVWTYSNVVTNTINRKSLKLMPTVSLNGEVGGDIEGQPSDAEIQTAVNRMNTNLSALKDIATCLKVGDHIIGISPLLEDSKTIGYTIDFHEGLPITIFYEKDGNNAVYSKLPDIGILKDTDGEYYWGIGDEWLLDVDGDKIMAGQPRGNSGSLPQIKTMNGEWYVSCNRGATWNKVEQPETEQTEELSSRPFADISKDGDYYIFFLSNGTLIKIPLCDPANVRHNHWNSKTWYAYGTSLTSGSVGKYVKYVEQLSGLKACNKGIPGGGIVVNTKVKNAVMNITDGKQDADLITLEVGANDAKAELGDPSDNTSDTFCGSLTQCINYLLMNTNARIVVMSSPTGKSTSSGGSTEHGYAERNRCIREVCRKCCVHYIGLGDESGLGWGRLNNNMDVSYNTDYIHHSDIGGYNLAQYIWSELKDIPLWFTSVPDDGTSYWKGKKMIWNGDSISYGSWLESPQTDAYPLLAGKALGMETYNFAIGGTYAAKPKGSFEKYYWDYDLWLSDIAEGSVDQTKKYLVKDHVNAQKPCRIYYYNGSSWKANSETGGWALVERVKEMAAVHPDADLIGIAVGTNDFYTAACPFGSTEAPEKLIEEMKQRYQYDESVNMIGLGELKKGMKLLSTSYTLAEGPEYTVCLNIPIVPGCEYRVNGGYRSWFLDADEKALSTLNLKDQDFRFVAPEGACYISITLSGDISKAYMYAAVSDIETNLTLSTFCGAIHTICKYLQTNYNGKDIVFVTPIERYQSWCNKPKTPNSLGYTLNDYADAIIEICSGYSIPVIDFYRYSGIDPHSDKSMFGDTDGKAVHPNEEGHKILASVVTRYLKDLKKQ